MPRRTLCCTLAVVLAAVMTSNVTLPAHAVAVTPVPVPADAETTPVRHTGDAADDPAIWVDPDDSSRSLVLGNDKRGALETYDLSGNVHQRITTATTFWGNVDVRQDVRVGGRTLDVVAAYNGGLRLYTVDPATRLLTALTGGAAAIPTGGGEGLCLYESAATGTVSAFVVTRAGRVSQYALTDSDSDGLLEAVLTRRFEVGSEAEGCVADDDNDALYVAEEDVGLWRYGAEPDSGTARTSLDTVQPTGHLSADVEGVTLVELASGGGYVIASAQNVAAGNQSYFVVYDRSSNAYVGTFRVVDGDAADGCQRTDGIAAYAGDLGPAYPQGLFVCQDNNNTAPGSVGNQNFKLVRLEKVVDLDVSPDPGPDPTGDVSFVAAASSNGNRVNHRVGIPLTVQTGDVLVAFFAGNATTTTVTGPAGWAESAALTGDDVLGRAWTRVATAADAGATLTVATSGYAKSDLSVVAYRGVQSPPTTTAAAETLTRATHTTPTSRAEAGSWVVGYWAEKSIADNSWDAPPGQVVRARSAGTGGGAVSALLSDGGAPVAAGTVGGLTATSGVATRKALMITVVLPPA
ncbi:MAG: phytase [Actinomycetota bacterium]|nr:phytase [Actinomycetota bacterium]